MANTTFGLSEELNAYLVMHSSRPDPLVGDLIEETRRLLPRAAGMQIAPEQAGFLELFTRIVGARYAVEVGTFTGLSSIAIARGMGTAGRLICCDVSEEYTAVAVRYWERAGLDDRIELRLGAALDTLRAMPAEPHIDLAFIDADKPGYAAYWTELVPRMRPGGVLLVDNVLWDGKVVEPVDETEKIIAEFNDLVRADERVDSVIIPLADGLTIARRK
jgi:predicted O-methyltransferase YrrM